jgi:cell division protein FtsL
MIILLVVLFGLGEIWKESQISRLCTRLDSLRSKQRQLNVEKLSLQLKYNDLASYARIEPLARERLGMLPAPKSPVIITSVDDHLLAYRKKSFEEKRK